MAASLRGLARLPELLCGRCRIASSGGRGTGNITRQSWLNPTRRHLSSSPRRIATTNAGKGARDTASAGSKQGTEKSASSSKVVIYRGPPASQTWLNIFSGLVFMGCGLELAVSIDRHLQWPLFSRDANNPPQPVSQTKRRIAAVVIGAIGIGTGMLFLLTPSKRIVRLTLDLRNRELIMRTAMREFSALLPRDLYPKALRRTAERKGWYRTDVLRERVVPLSSVYRVRGSAVASRESVAPNVRYVDKKAPAREPGATTPSGAERQPHPSTIEIRTAGERMFYTMEASGGAKPTSRGYAGAWARISYAIRGHTDWSSNEPGALNNGGPDRVSNHAPPKVSSVGAQQNTAQTSTASLVGAQARGGLDPKEPWFADRRAFDDIIPRIDRKG